MTPEDYMPFGKHMGKKMKDVPHDWFMWLYRKGVTGAIRNYIEDYVIPLSAPKTTQYDIIVEQYAYITTKQDIRYNLHKLHKEETDPDKQKIWTLLLEKALLTNTCQKCSMTIHRSEFGYVEKEMLLPVHEKCRGQLYEDLSIPSEPRNYYKPYDPMPFGRFMNVPLCEVPSWYMLEIQSDPDISEKLRSYIKVYKEDILARSRYDM